MKASEFDELFEIEDIAEHLDFSKKMDVREFEKKIIKTKKINVDLPENILYLIDKEASKIGVTRQSIIKVWLAERLKSELSSSL
ncbi:MAG: type II toxin-antitoxin system BrnA family antitoxin [Campylobacterales bacterium]